MNHHTDLILHLNCISQNPECVKFWDISVSMSAAFTRGNFRKKIPSCVNIGSAVSAGAWWFDRLSTFNTEVNYVNPPSLFSPIQKLNALISKYSHALSEITWTPQICSQIIRHLHKEILWFSSQYLSAHPYDFTSHFVTKFHLPLWCLMISFSKKCSIIGAIGKRKFSFKMKMQKYAQFPKISRPYPGVETRWSLWSFSTQTILWFYDVWSVSIQKRRFMTVWNPSLHKCKKTVEITFLKMVLMANFWSLWKSLLCILAQVKWRYYGLDFFF